MVTGFRSAQLLVFVHTLLLLTSSRAEVIGVNLEDAGEGGPQPSVDAESGVANLYDPLLRLNRYTFHKTLLEQHADEVPHWIVLFCPNWYEPCQALQPIYRQLAEKWQEELNGDLLSNQVRFASVDCALEKELCNTQNVGMDYPFVGHYHHRQQVGTWRGKSYETDEQRIKKWLVKQLGAVYVAKTAKTQPEEDITDDGKQSVRMDCLLIFAAIVGNAWFISRGGSGGEAAEGVKQQMAGSTSVPSQAQQQQPASCVARSLPKEWGNDRPSFEL